MNLLLETKLILIFIFDTHELQDSTMYFDISRRSAFSYNFMQFESS